METVFLWISKWHISEVKRGTVNTLSPSSELNNLIHTWGTDCGCRQYGSFCPSLGTLPQTVLHVYRFRRTLLVSSLIRHKRKDLTHRLFTKLDSCFSFHPCRFLLSCTSEHLLHVVFTLSGVFLWQHHKQTWHSYYSVWIVSCVSMWIKMFLEMMPCLLGKR